VVQVALRPIEDSDLNALFAFMRDPEVTYRIDRAFRGQGIAGRALVLLLEALPVRPVFARVASDNPASLRVLRRAGFVITGTDVGFANARRAEIEETLLRLDGPADAVPSDAAVCSDAAGGESGR
jgi:L-amino acid N-acyltransferase YncA